MMSVGRSDHSLPAILGVFLYRDSFRCLFSSGHLCPLLHYTPKDLKGI